MKTFTCLILLATVVGCNRSSHRSSVAFDELRRQVAERNVVLPQTTPFNADRARRAVYLEWYWFGYKEGSSGTTSSFCGNGHPLYEV